MAKRQSIAEARNHLPSLVREAESGKTVELTRRGEPVAVLIGRRQYQRLATEQRSFSKAYDQFTRDVDLAELGIDPEEFLAGVRDRSAGRKVDV